MPGGVEALSAMGVEIPRNESMQFGGITFIDGDCSARAEFTAGTGLGIRRTTLSAAMRRRASELGAALHTGTRVLDYHVNADGGVRIDTTAGPFDAKLLVAADGLHSELRRKAGLDARARGPIRHGVRRHYKISPWASLVEVYWADGFEAYVTPVTPNEVGIALLWTGRTASYDALLERLPALAGHVRDASPSSNLAGASRLHQRAKSRFAPGVALVGDAAGFVDAITGEGLTLSFRCARALIETLDQNAPLVEYERAYRKITRTYYFMTQLLVRIGMVPALRYRMVAMLAHHPDLFNQMLELNTGQRSLSMLRARDLARLVGGLLTSRD